MALRLPQGSKSLPIKSNFCKTQRILGESRGNSSFLLRLFAPRLLVRISLVGRWLWGEVGAFLKTFWQQQKSPIVVQLVLLCSGAALSFLELVCLYGYSLSIYIPVSILWLIQVVIIYKVLLNSFPPLKISNTP